MHEITHHPEIPTGPIESEPHGIAQITALTAITSALDGIELGEFDIRLISRIQTDGGEPAGLVVFASLLQRVRQISAEELGEIYEIGYAAGWNDSDKLAEDQGEEHLEPGTAVAEDQDEEEEEEEEHLLAEDQEEEHLEPGTAVAEDQDEDLAGEDQAELARLRASMDRRLARIAVLLAGGQLATVENSR